MATVNEIYTMAQHFYALRNPYVAPPFDAAMVEEFLGDYDPEELVTAEQVDNFCQDFLDSLVDDPATEQRVYY